MPPKGGRARKSGMSTRGERAAFEDTAENSRYVLCIINSHKIY